MIEGSAAIVRAVHTPAYGWLRRACLTLLAALTALSSSSPALALDPDVPLAQVAFRTWGRRDGLPTDSVGAIVRGRDGMVWLGSDSGLIVMDGVNVTRYTTANVPALPADAISSLASEGDTLWIGTARGLARWDAGVFSGVDRESGVPNTRISSIYVGRSGGLWLCTEVGVFARHGARFEPLLDADGKRTSYVCSSLVELADGSLLLACGEVLPYRNGGLGAPLGLGLRTNELVLGPDGAVWLGTSDTGVYRLAEGRAELMVPRKEPASDMFFDSRGALWVSGTGPSIVRRSPSGLIESLMLPNGQAPMGESLFVEEPDGSMLVTSSNMGLMRLQEGSFRTFDPRSGAPEAAISVYEDRAHRVWMAGSDLEEVVAFPADGKPPQHFALARPALAHVETTDGSHYLGGPDGLFRVAGDVLQPVPVNLETTIDALATTADGAVWIGSMIEGLTRMVGGVASKIDGPHEAPLHALALLVSRDGKRLWVGTNTGLFYIDGVDHGPGATAVFLGERVGVPAGMILALHEDRVGSIWAGTYEHGLVRIRDGHGVVLTQRQGLRQDSHYAVLEDAAERFWLPGPSGIVRVARSDLDALADGLVRAVDARLMGVADGLPVDETTGGGMCAIEGSDGRMWFATPKGVVVTDPNRPDRTPVSPATLIEEIQMGGVSLPREGSSQPADARDLLVRYTAPTFERAADVRFRYRLDGVDPDWVDAGTRRIAMYADLPPGPHRFQVEAIAAGATGHGKSASFSIAIATSFSETLAFKLLVAGLALGLLYAGHRFRLARVFAREAQLSRLVDERTTELAASQKELEGMNASLAQRIEDAVAKLRSAERMAAYGHTVAGVAHEVRQPLFALGTTAFVLGDKLRDRTDLKADLQLLERETRRMNRVMEELLDFAKPRGLLLGPNSVAGLVQESIEVFRAEHDPDNKVPIGVVLADGLVDIRVDTSRIEQVLVNLMHNAQKHAAGLTQLSISARQDAENIVIELADDGGGIRESDLLRIFEPFFTTGGTGLGLAIASRIIEDHEGSIEVSSSPRGTTFRIALPIHGPANAS